MTCKCFCILGFSVISKIRMYVKASLIIFNRGGGATEAVLTEVARGGKIVGRSGVVDNFKLSSCASSSCILEISFIIVEVVRVRHDGSLKGNCRG